MGQDGSGNLIAEGESSKRFKIYRADAKGQPHEKIAEYDTIEEVLGHRWRLDRVELIHVKRKYLTRREFEVWAAEQKAKQDPESATAVPPTE